jgi:hypothetical protein
MMCLQSEMGLADRESERSAMAAVQAGVIPTGQLTPVPPMPQ